MALTQISTKGIKDGTITGTDLATNVDLVDNQKIRLGTGNDLQIYHDGSNSYLQNNTGLLYVRGGGDWLALQAEDGENSIICKPNGTVELYHDGSKRFETTTAGATLSGTQTVQAGAFSSNVTTGNKSFTASIDIQSTSMRGGVVVRNMNDFRSESVFNASFMHYDPFDTTANSFAFRAARGSTLADTFSVRSDGRTFVGERLSIGEASPSHKLHISADENTTIAYFDTDLGGRGLKINTFTSGNAASAGVEFEAPAGANKSAFVFKGASEFMRIHPSGDVSIGSDSNAGANRLNVVENSTDAFVNPSDSILRLTNENTSSNTNQTSISFSTSTTSASSDSAIVSKASGSGSSNLLFFTDTNNGMTEKMRIETSGNIGIGTTSANVSGFNADARVLTISGPKRALIELRGNIQANDTIGVIRFMSGNNNEAAIVSIADSGFAGDLRFRTHGGERMVIDKNGNIGAPSGSNIHQVASDLRLKKNIVDLDKGLSAIKSLRPVSFNWIDGFCDEEKDTLYGFIAQEVQSIDSNLIEPSGRHSITVGEQTIDNPLRIKEKFIIPMLVKAIQELEAKVEALETEVAALKAG